MLLLILLLALLITVSIYLYLFPLFYYLKRGVFSRNKTYNLSGFHDVEIYLNDEYTGGETLMEGDVITPEKGKLVIFDSDNLHGVNEVKDVERFTMPMWFTNLPDWYEIGASYNGEYRRRKNKKWYICKRFI